MESAYIDPDIKKLPARQKIMEYSGLFFVSAIHLFLFSLWTSPYYRLWYGCDASFFTLVGRGILNGKIPYRDFFDLKGPYFFFVEALGQLLAHDRLGAFLIQIPFAFASLVLIYEICLLFISKKKALFVMLVYLWGNITTLWGGNTLEEFALPLSLACLYAVLKAVVRNKKTFNELPDLLIAALGLCLGIDIFSKISVGAPVLGIIAAVLYANISSKNFRRLLINIVYILLGVAVAALPVIIYFGANGALSDMFFCVFVLGFSRSTNYYESFNLTWELKLSGCVFAFIFAVLHRDRLKKELSIMLMAMSAATWLLLHLGTPFYYYFTTVYPVLILALILLLKTYKPFILFENRKQAAVLALFFVYLCYYIPSGLDSVQTVLYDRDFEAAEQFYENATDIGALIPECDRGSVFSFMIDMQMFEANDIIPCCRYVVNLPFFIELYPQAQTDILDMLENDPPKWLIIGNDFEENLPEIAGSVFDKYECIYDNAAGQLYLLSGEEKR
ncbi:MAG: hypothetical protein K6F73_04925 [Lachnospiraceae bacterium]|nr:hypothetical protein [Lachnospiraceae bacterium]